MSDQQSPFQFLRSKPALVVAAVLACEILLFYTIPTKEYVPTPPPLDIFATNLGPWTMTAQYPLADDALKLLKADDTLTRDYRGVGPGKVELFVAFFKSQQAGVTPHSPKMCLPANGWTEQSSSIVPIKVPGETLPIPVNRYVVSREEQRRLVLYWFQNWHRATADEYLSKMYVLLDSLRYRRSDEALIRVVTDINGTSDSEAEAHAIQFLQDVYQPLKHHIWAAPSNVALIP